MTTTEARIIANRKNSGKSTGPKTVAGKESSRRNSLKHGMTGQGVVVAEADSVEVERRNQTLSAELAPQSVIGQILVRELATLSVRMERSARQEFAGVENRVRHAAELFDVDRVETAIALIKGLADDPKTNLRLLCRRPEGVDLLLQAWRVIRADLTHELRPSWTTDHVKKAAHLVGLKHEELRGTRLADLSQAAMGVLGTLMPHEEKAGLEGEARKAWARTLLVDWVDGVIDGLNAQRQSLDVDAIEQDRAEAGDRALFDPSKEATLARRYESEARRGFFRALNQFRQVETETAERLAIAATSEKVETCNPLASSWEPTLSGTQTETTRPRRQVAEAFSETEAVARGRDGRVVTVGRGVLTPA